MTIKSTLNKVLKTPKMKGQDILIATLSTISLGLISSGAVMLGNRDSWGAILVTVGIVIIFVRQNLK